MKKVLLSIGVILIIIGAYIFTTKKTPSTEETTQVKSFIENKSFFDLVNDGESYQCNYSVPLNGGAVSNGKIYISKGKIRDENRSSIGNTPIETIMLVSDSYMYTWTSTNETKAFKTKITPTTLENPEIPANTLFLENKKMIDTSTYQCKTWTPDESLFEFSKNIKIEEPVPKTIYINLPIKVTTPINKEPVTVPTPVPPGPTTFTMSDIALHNNRTSCYTTIGGKVYDVTSYIDRHKGGASKILQICGKDGSSLFEGQHEGQMKPEQMLATFEIGILK